VLEFKRERTLRIIGSVFYAIRDWSTEREINRSVQSIVSNQTIKTVQKKFFG